MKAAVWVAAVGSAAFLVGCGTSRAAAGATTSAGVGALGGPPGNPAATQVTTIVPETFDARFPVFFLPKSSVLSPLAVARAARTAGSETIILVQASSDHEAGETTQTATQRSDAVRLELIRDGIPASAIRIMHAKFSLLGEQESRQHPGFGGRT